MNATNIAYTSPPNALYFIEGESIAENRSTKKTKNATSSGVVLLFNTLTSNIVSTSEPA